MSVFFGSYVTQHEIYKKDEWEIDLKHLNVGEKLGSGTFGIVRFSLHFLLFSHRNEVLIRKIEKNNKFGNFPSRCTAVTH